MTTPTPMLNGAVLSQAERASRAVLDRLLARSGTSFHHYLAMTVAAGQGGTVERDTLVDRMVAGLKLDPAIVRAEIESAETDGLLRSEGGLTSLTDAGRARYARITSATDEVTARLYADLPAEDLKVAGRMLTILTERANAELANR